MKVSKMVNLKKVLEKHQKWLDGEAGGEKADLSGAGLMDVDLSKANLRRADLFEADLIGANLYGANLHEADLGGANLNYANLMKANLNYANLYNATLSYANLYEAYLNYTNLCEANFYKAKLSYANFYKANLSCANLIETNLSCANLEEADLRRADLTGANLTGADLRGAILYGANLSDTKGLSSQHDFIDKLEKCDDGVIVYKVFGKFYNPNKNWVIEAGSIIEETVNYDRAMLCGCGVNVATKEWIWFKTIGDVWQCLIRWEWLLGVCVPYNTDGKFRCEKVQLLKVVSREELKEE